MRSWLEKFYEQLCCIILPRLVIAAVVACTAIVIVFATWTMICLVWGIICDACGITFNLLISTILWLLIFGIGTVIVWFLLGDSD